MSMDSHSPLPPAIFIRGGLHNTPHVRGHALALLLVSSVGNCLHLNFCSPATLQGGTSLAAAAPQSAVIVAAVMSWALGPLCGLTLQQSDSPRSCPRPPPPPTPGADCPRWLRSRAAGVPDTACAARYVTVASPQSVRHQPPQAPLDWDLSWVYFLGFPRHVVDAGVVFMIEGKRNGLAKQCQMGI